MGLPTTSRATGGSDPARSAVDAAAAKRLHDRLGLALEAGGLGVWEWDVEAGSVVWDRVLEAIYGFPPGGFDGTVEAYRERIHPDDRAAAAATAAEARRNLVPYETEHRVVRPDGSIRWTHGWARPLFDDAGRLLAFIGVVADITERREQDEERERERADAEAARLEAEWSAQQYATLAATLQRSLLPPVPPAIPGLDVATCYHPAGDGLLVGGDFYDIPRLGRQSWGLVLGDVCGKGASAAALTGLLRYTARAAAMQHSTPARVLRQVNDVLRHDLEGDEARFATMLFARLRPRADRLDVAFALGGHPPPFVVRADGNVEPVGEPGTLLGVLPSGRFATTTLVLRPGDQLVVVTDGVLEARDRTGRQLGDHLAPVLLQGAGSTAAVTVAALEEAALSWQGGLARDDIAVVVVRVPNREPAPDP